MSEIKVGEYVRTKDGIIAKVTYIDEYVAKHSFNIIDLIEEGDYVNGCKVDMINKYSNEKELLCNDYNLDDSVVIIKNEDIKTIVTKEQFEESEYKV